MEHELRRRPSLLLAVCLISGIVASEAWLFAALFLSALWLGPSLSWKGAMAAAFAVGVLISPVRVPQVQELSPYDGVGRVASIPEISETSQSLILESQGNSYSLRCRETSMLAVGDRIAVRGTLGPLPDGLLRDQQERSLSGHIRAEKDGIRVLSYGPALFRMGVDWRAGFVDFVRKSTVPEASAIINALCFNVTSDLDSSTFENLQRTGTIHIVSASGLHVLIFAAGLSALFSLLPIPRGYRLALIGIVLVVYAIGAGMKPPVIRSVAMAAIMGLATLLRREPDLLSALGITAVAYLLWRPAAVYDLGFQFSFATVAALGMFLKHDETRVTRPLPRLAADAMQVIKASLVATLASLPLTTYYFGMASVVSIPANVMIATALPAITMTAFAAHALSSAFPALSAGLMVGCVQPLSGWVLWTAESLGSLTIAAVRVPSFSALWMVPYYAFLVLLWRPRARPL